MKLATGRLVGAVLGAVAMALSSATGPASADDASVVPITAEEEALSRAFMTEFGVDVAVQDQLLAATRAGQVSLADGGTQAPTSVETFARDGSNYTVSTYSDGSILVEEREIPVEVEDGAVTTFSGVSDCTIGGSSGYTTYTRCKVSYQSHVFSYGYRASFSQVTGGRGTISWVGEKYQNYAIGHTRADWGLKICQATSSVSSGPAKARLFVEYNILPNFGQITKYLRLNVSSSAYSWVDYNC